MEIFFFLLIVFSIFGSSDAFHVRRDAQNPNNDSLNKSGHDQIIHYRGVRIKKVEGLTACLPNDYSYSIKSLIISESNTYECNEENIEVHSDFRPGCGEPLRTETFFLSSKHSCLQSEQTYSPICLRVKTSV